MPRAPTVPTDINNDRVMRAWYQALKNSSDGIILSVRDFGAVGDGGRDDTQAFKEAIAFAENNQNVLYIPAGNFRITEELELLDSITIYGQGPGLSVIEPHLPEAGGNLFNMTGGGSLIIKDLAFDGTDAPQTDPTEMVHIINVEPTSGPLECFWFDNLEFKNLNLKKGTWGVDADGDLRATHCIVLDEVNKVTITNCKADTVTGAFCYVSNCNDILIDNNKLDTVGWYPIHLEEKVRYFTISNNVIENIDTGGSIFGGFIDILESVSTPIPNSGTDNDKTVYNNGVVENNYLAGESIYPAAINLLSMSGVIIKNNILNGITLGTDNMVDDFMYNINIGTRGASNILFVGPPMNINVEGNMIRSGENGGPKDYGVRVENDFQSASVGTEMRPMERISVTNNMIGFHLYDTGVSYPDINMDKGIYFDGLNGGLTDITCENNTLVNLATAQSAADGAGVIDILGSLVSIVDGVKVGGNRIKMNGSPTALTVVGLNIGDYVENVVNTKPNHFIDTYTAVETGSTGVAGLSYLDDQVLDGVTDPYIFGTELDDVYHTNISGTTANRPASGANRTDYMTYFDTDLGVPVWFNGTSWINALGGSGGAIPTDLYYSAGYADTGATQDVTVSTFGQRVMARDGTITGEQGYATVAPTGAALIVDIEKNGTSVYTTAPQFAAGSQTLTAGTLKTDGTEDFVEGDRLVFKITQIGSTEPGEGVDFTLQCSVT